MIRERGALVKPAASRFNRITIFQGMNMKNVEQLCSEAQRLHG
jgi:hypothetical protein